MTNLLILTFQLIQGATNNFTGYQAAPGSAAVPAWVITAPWCDTGIFTVAIPGKTSWFIEMDNDLFSAAAPYACPAPQTNCGAAGMNPLRISLVFTNPSAGPVTNLLSLPIPNAAALGEPSGSFYFRARQF